MLKRDSFRSTIKYEIAPQAAKLLFKKLSYFSTGIRMRGKNINLEDKKIKKSYFYKNKKVLKVDEIDINKILVSKKEPYRANKSIKYFIGYNDNDVIRPLCIKLLQLIGYGKCFKNKNVFQGY